MRIIDWSSDVCSSDLRFAGFARTTDTRIPVADGSHIGIALGEVVLDPFSESCVAHRRVLDMRSACMIRMARWRLADGGEIALRVERVVTFAHSNLLCIRHIGRASDRGRGGK